MKLARCLMIQRPNLSHVMTPSTCKCFVKLLKFLLHFYSIMFPWSLF